MPVMTEPVHTGEFIVSEGNNSISRERIELSPDLILLPGTVLGKNTATAVFGPLDPAADNGLQMAAGVLWDHVSTDATGGAWRSRLGNARKSHRQECSGNKEVIRSR